MGNSQPKNKAPFPLRPNKKQQEQIAKDYLYSLTSYNALIKVDDILACPYFDSVKFFMDKFQTQEAKKQFGKGYYLIHENFISTNLKKILDVIKFELGVGEWWECFYSNNLNTKFWLTLFPRDYETLKKLIFDDLSYAEELIAKTDRVLAELTYEQKILLSNMYVRKSPIKNPDITNPNLFGNEAKNLVHLSRHPNLEIYGIGYRWVFIPFQHIQYGKSTFAKFCYFLTKEQVAIVMQPIPAEIKTGVARINAVIDEISFEPVKRNNQQIAEVASDLLEEGAVAPRLVDDSGADKPERQNEQLNNAEDNLNILVDIIEASNN